MVLPYAVLLDVTLQRDGNVRRWSIVSSPRGWLCKVEGPGFAKSNVCDTSDLARVVMRAWEAEIAVAQAGGWEAPSGGPPDDPVGIG